MTRGGRRDETDGPERKCIATGEAQPKTGLIRFVVGPDAVVVPDLAEKLPGRGIWVSADRAALDRAAKKGLFSRAAKAPVTVPPDLADRVEALLVDRVVHLVSLARKAGEAVTGFEKVKEWLAQGRARVLLQASDGSERGKAKLWTPPGGRYFGCLTAGELGLAFGRDYAIHGALAAGGLASRVVEEAAKLSGLRLAQTADGQQDGGESAGKDTKSE
ncbi:RNA-binding protein [Frigidibacter oleivorans]|uniref:RNA-binding protein n=1 Tax=Frigidibacter oleivorans TaxID=2487129 RepID=UPI000F8E6FF4|nr:RNA-binding protein [Frigidibacter oleivorans]